MFTKCYIEGGDLTTMWNAPKEAKNSLTYWERSLLAHPLIIWQNHIAIKYLWGPWIRNSEQPTNRQMSAVERFDEKLDGPFKKDIKHRVAAGNYLSLIFLWRWKYISRTVLYWWHSTHSRTPRHRQHILQQEQLWILQRRLINFVYHYHDNFSHYYYH